MSRRILGLNLSHDSSACLVVDGRITTALALERTTGVKRGTVPLHAYPAAMADLVSEVLAASQLTTRDVDYWITTSTESRDSEDERRLASALGLLVPPGQLLALPHPAHHLAHASAAFYTSGFDEATALVIDAYGSRIGSEQRERETAFAFHRGMRPETLLQNVRESSRIAGRALRGSLVIPNSLSGIGELYRVVTLALGFSEPGSTYDDAGKTMGLASFGQRLSASSLFIDVVDGELRFDHAAQSLIDLNLAEPYEGQLRLLLPGPRAPQRHDLAAQIQAEFEEACLFLVDKALALGTSRCLVLSGGCFLNGTLNTRIARELELDGLYVFPAATDDGNAAGAALYAHHVLLPPEETRNDPGSASRLQSVALGPSRLGPPAATAVPCLAAARSLTCTTHEDVSAMTHSAARAIARGEIVAWFQDKAEFGPRALGSRSILCHPGLPGMKDRLNARVKFRETFRPFAASVLSEHTSKWFDVPCLDQGPFMLSVHPVHPGQRERISEVVHVDGTCRLQTVSPDLPIPYRSLIEQFEAITGLPMILNTSFNVRGKPIVEYPEEALDCLYGSRLDRLFIGNHEIAAPDLSLLIPERTDREAPRQLTAEHTALLAAFGDNNLQRIATGLGLDTELAIEHCLELRRSGLLRWRGVPVFAAVRYPLPQYDPTTGRE